MKNNFQSKSVPRGTRTIWRYLGALFLILTLSIGQMWGAINNTTVTKTGGSQKYLDVATTAASEGDEVTVSEQYIAYTVNELVSSAIKGVWYTQSSSGSGSSNTDAVSITGYRSTCSKYIGISSSKKYTHYVTNCVSFSALYDPRGGSRYCTITATNVDDEEDIVTITNSGTVSSGTKYNVALTGLSASKYYRVVVETNNGSDSRLYQIRLEAPAATPVCPSGLTISSKDSKVAFMEGDKIELTATLSAGNGAITYQWYKGGTAEGNKLTGKTAAKLEIASCTTADEGDYFCVASKDDCSDAVNAAAFAITVEADTKCFNMPAIASKPSNLAAVSVEGGTLAEASVNDKTVSMDGNGLKLGGNDSRLKVTLTGASITEGTKITVAYKGASTDGSGIGIFDGNCANQTLDATGLKNAGSVSHTFTAVEAANYADEFIINRNGTGKNICVNAITVEDCGPAVTKHTVTLNYNDGATPDGSLKVVDGNAAVKPADPTRGKYTFLGWFVGETDDEYVWTTAVTDDITLKAHWQDPWTLTFDADGGSAVANVTVKHNTKAEKPADPTKDDNDFLGWFYGDPAVEFDWDANVTQDYALVAHWQLAVAKYDVEYYDGETKIGTEEQVWATAHPTAAGIETAKPLYSFVGWYLTSALEGDPVNLNTVTPVEGLKIYGKWAKAYAANIDFEAFIDANTTDGDWSAELADKHYAISSTTGVTLDAPNGKPADKGLKIKNSGSYLSFNVHAGKLVLLKAGVLSGAEASVDGGAHYATLTGATGSTAASVVTPLYNAAEAEYRIRTTTGSYNIIQSITIQDPYQVTFDANGGDDVASLNGTPSVTLPSATKGTESFLGWFTEATGGEKIGDAGESYTPTADITLHAQWEAVSTDARLASITFSSDAGTLSPAFDPEVTSYTYTMPYGTAAIPTITGATSVNAKAQDPIIGDAAAAWSGTQTVQGVAQSGDKKTYTITMAKAPKDGVCLVWGDIPSDNTITYNATNSKVYKAEEVSLVTNVNGKDDPAPSGVKFQNNDYVKVALNEGTFKAGDILALDVTYGTANKMYVYKAQSAAAADIIGELDGTTTPADLNKVAITEDAAALWLVRAGQSSSWNPHVDYVAVYRIMNPELMAIAIDERAGVIDPLDDKHFNVQIPYEADLANLTIVPTIAWNAPHATTPEAVISNEGAWIIGDNTYRLMDKDGDYTDYTITLTRDVLKHTVSFNTHGGSAVASVEVVDGQKLAAAPADPTKDENVFKFWSETEDGAEVDVTTVQINADKEFHAVWEAEPAGIKLINGDVVNHTNFLTGTNETTVEIESVEHKCVDFTTAGSNRTTVASISDLKEFIQYNATTNKAKIKLTLYNTKSSAVSAYLHMLEEGSETPTTEEISIPAGEVLKTDFYEFNSEKNRSFYITCGNRDYIKVLQVKVIDDGTTTLKKAGQVGYSVNTLKSRIFAPQQSAISFEGLTINANAVCKPLSTTALKIKNNYNISFHADAAMTLAVTTEGNQTYYVSATADGTTNETSFTGRKEFEITAGDWYIHAGNSELKVAKLEFIAPKCEKPTVVDMENIGLCEGDAFIALNVSASVTDGGTLHYQWYKHPAEGDDEEVGTDAASYTPEADGQYYVVVTNKLADHTDNAKTSNMVTVAHFAAAAITTAPADQRKEAGQVATLTVVATGKAPLTYQWYTCDDEAGNNPVIIDGADEATYEVTVTAAMSQYYKVVVGSGCGSAEAVALVEEWHEVTPANVTGSRTWDWSTAGMGEIATESGSVEYLMANVSSKVTNTEEFRSDMLYITANYANRSASNKFFQGWQIRFYTEVPGRVSMNCRAIHGTMSITVNGTVIDDAKGSDMGTATTPFFVPAGWVTIAFDNQSSGYVGEAARVQKITFNATPDYSRPVSSNYGTLCVEHNVPAGQYLGATFYQIASRNEDYDYKIDFEEVLPNEELKAGEPYLFKSNTGKIELFYGEQTAANPIPVRGMIGNYAATSLPITEENKNTIYYFAQNKLWLCDNLVGSNLILNEHRAYINLTQVPTYAEYEASKQQQNSAPRRRVSLEMNGEQVATGCENLNVSDKPVKMIINGQLFILRGEKMYDAKGQLVK